MRTDDLWLELHIGLPAHPKTARLKRRLGVTLPQTIGHLLMTWLWSVRYAPNGDLSRFDADVIADAAGWDDDPGQFVRAMISAGFFDEDLRIHDWDAYAGRLLDKREANARRMREARVKARPAPNGHEPDSARAAHATGARAAHVQGLHNITGPDITGPDSTPPPNPLRTAEGAEALTPTTDDDVAVWATALHLSTRELLKANADAMHALEPVGRGPDGGLRLRAPPEYGDLRRFMALARRALSDAGDAAGTKATIVTGA